MASTSAVPEKNDIAALKDAVYEACLPFSSTVFTQTNLFAMNLIKQGDLQTLLTVTQGLVDDKRFKVVHSEGLGWKIRSREEARKSDTPLLSFVLLEFTILL
jgi:DNA-directed RNA polymerase III subunit RPC6